MIICLCEGVSDKSVEKAVRCGAETVKEVGKLCGAGTGCNSCHCDIKKIIREEGKRAESLAPTSRPRLVVVAAS